MAPWIFDATTADGAVGTGPFMLSQWVRDQQVVFVRNPHYFHHGVPYLDKVILKVVPNSSVQILQVQRGQADVLTDPDAVSGLDYLRLKSDPRFTVVQGDVPTGFYCFGINCTMPPFDNKLVRQALNYAINRKRWIDGYFAAGERLQPQHRMGSWRVLR